MRGVALVLAMAGAYAALCVPAHARSYLFAPAFASNVISVFDAGTGKLVKHVGAEHAGPCCAHGTPDGTKVFVVGGQSPWVSIIDTATLKVVKRTRLIGTWGDRGSTIGRKSRLFWVSDLPEGHLEALDIKTGEVVRRFRFIANTYTVSRDGKNLYSVNLTDGPGVIAPAALTFAVRSSETGKSTARTHLPLTLEPVPLVMYASPDDTKVYVQLFNTRGTLHVVDVRDRAHPRYVKTVEVGATPVQAMFTPDGKQLWFPNSGDGTVGVLDVARDEIVKTIHIGPYVAGVAFDGNKAFVSISPGTLANPVLSIPLIFLALMPGANLNPPSGSTVRHPLFLELPGEIQTYDRRTYERLPRPVMTTPSLSHIMDVVKLPKRKRR